MSILELKNVSVKYGTGDSAVFALKEVNLKIEKGDIISIIGPSGAGKSTLLSVLGGLEKPTSGEYLYDNVDYYSLSQKEMSKKRLVHFGFVFQAFYLISSLTVKDNILLPVVADKKEIDNDLFDELVNTLGIKDRLMHYPNELSGGEKQRTAIARALINKPTVLYADEPTGNLDSRNGETVFRMLIDMAKKNNQTLIYVTHDMSKANLADKTYTIKDGILNEKK